MPKAKSVPPPAQGARAGSRRSSRLADLAKPRAPAVDESSSASSSESEQEKPLAWDRKKRPLAAESRTKTTPAKQAPRAGRVPATNTKPPKHAKVRLEVSESESSKRSDDSDAESDASASSSAVSASKKPRRSAENGAKSATAGKPKPVTRGAAASSKAASSRATAAAKRRAGESKREESTGEGERTEDSGTDAEGADAPKTPPKKRAPARTKAAPKPATRKSKAAKSQAARAAEADAAAEEDEDSSEEWDEGNRSGKEDGVPQPAGKQRVGGKAGAGGKKGKRGLEEEVRELVAMAGRRLEAEGLPAMRNPLLALASLPDSRERWRATVAAGFVDLAVPCLLRPEAPAVRVQLSVGALLHHLAVCCRADGEAVAGRLAGTPGALAAVARLVRHRDTVRDGVVVNALDLLTQLALLPAARARLAEETRAAGEEAGVVAGALLALREHGATAHMPQAATALLSVLADDDGWREELVGAGAIRDLIRFLRAPAEQVHAEAAQGALACLASLAEDGDEVAACVREERAAGALARHLAAEGAGRRAAAALLVAELARDEAVHAELRQRGAVAGVVALLHGDDASARGAAAAAAAALAAASERGAAEVRVQGGVRPLLQLLRERSAETAAAAAVHSLSAEEGCREEIVVAGGVAPLVHLLRGASDGETATHALGALLNLTASSAAGQEAAESAMRAVARYGGVKALVAALRRWAAGEAGHAGELEAACGLVTNLAYLEELRAELRDEGAVAALCPGLAAGRPAGVRAAAAGALGDLALSPDAQADVAAAAAAPLAALLADPAAPPHARAAAAAAVANTAEGSDEARGRLLEAAGGLPAALVALLAAGDPAAARAAANALAALASAATRPALEAAGAAAALTAACAAEEGGAARAASEALARLEGRTLQPEPRKEEPAAPAAPPAPAPAPAEARPAAAGPAAAGAAAAGQKRKAGAGRRQLSVRVWKEERGIAIACPDTMEELVEAAAGRLGRLRGGAVAGRALMNERGDVVEDMETLLACRDAVYYLAP